MPFDMMVLFYLFLITSLFSGTIRCSRLFCILSAPELESASSPQRSDLFYWKSISISLVVLIAFWGNAYIHIYHIYNVNFDIYKCIHANRCFQMHMHLYLLCIYQPVCVCICIYDVPTHIHIATSNSNLTLYCGFQHSPYVCNSFLFQSKRNQSLIMYNIFTCLINPSIYKLILEMLTHTSVKNKFKYQSTVFV